MFGIYIFIDLFSETLLEWHNAWECQLYTLKAVQHTEQSGLCKEVRFTDYISSLTTLTSAWSSGLHHNICASYSFVSALASSPPCPHPPCLSLSMEETPGPRRGAHVQLLLFFRPSVLVMECSPNISLTSTETLLWAIAVVLTKNRIPIVLSHGILERPAVTKGGTLCSIKKEYNLHLSCSLSLLLGNADEIIVLP